MNKLRKKRGGWEPSHPSQWLRFGGRIKGHKTRVSVCGKRVQVGLGFSRLLPLNAGGLLAGYAQRSPRYSLVVLPVDLRHILVQVLDECPSSSLDHGLHDGRTHFICHVYQLNFQVHSLTNSRWSINIYINRFLKYLLNKQVDFPSIACECHQEWNVPVVESEATWLRSLERLLLCCRWMMKDLSVFSSSFFLWILFPC